MRRIITAISSAALALSLVASAVPANAAVAGYDSAYAGESAFLTLNQGTTGTFTVFFLNTGTTTWTRGTSTQVDLAACLEDKTTCNAQDATEAPFNSGWLSATRYATSTQTSVAPGQVGTFSYNVAVPAAQAGGTYRFNGALLKADTAEDIHNEGYYQDVTVPGAAGGAATITTLTPSSGTSGGGTSVTIAGSGFVCTPVFPTVNFGSNAATVSSCGSTSLVATSPAGAVGAVNVTVTNTGAAASNALTYTYTDTTRPSYLSVSVTGGATNAVATLTWSEAICEEIGDALVTAGGADPDIVITVNGLERDESGETLATCNAETSPTNGATTFTVSFAGPIVNGDTVAVTISASGADSIRDVANNNALPQTQTATATADTTAPSIASAIADTTSTLKLTYNEPVTCPATEPGQFSATPTGGSAVAATGLACTAGPTGSTTVTLTFPASTFTSGTGGTVTYTQSATPANRVEDVVGNDATSPESDAYAAFSADASAPTLVDTRLTTSGGFTTQLDSGDTFKIAFSEAMNTDSAGDIIRVTDADGTVGDLQCASAAPAAPTGQATCSWNTANETLGGVTYAAGRVMTVLILVTPGSLTGFAGTSAGMSIPATIVDMSGVTDAAGNAVNVGGSADRVIDVE